VFLNAERQKANPYNLIQIMLAEGKNGLWLMVYGKKDFLLSTINNPTINFPTPSK